jgi:hypothetical protein
MIGDMANAGTPAIRDVRTTLPGIPAYAMLMTMASRRPVTRLFATLWAVLQFALPLAVSYGDALDALRSVGQYRTHVEATTTATCRPVHPEECALCRFLTNSDAVAARADLPIVVARQCVAGPDARVTISRSASLGLPSPRAPPIG